jgi:hypothetical protein
MKRQTNKKSIQETLDRLFSLELEREIYTTCMLYLLYMDSRGKVGDAQCRLWNNLRT